MRGADGASVSAISPISLRRLRPVLEQLGDRGDERLASEGFAKTRRLREVVRNSDRSGEAGRQENADVPPKQYSRNRPARFPFEIDVEQPCVEALGGRGRESVVENADGAYDGRARALERFPHRPCDDKAILRDEDAEPGEGATVAGA